MLLSVVCDRVRITTANDLHLSLFEKHFENELFFTPFHLKMMGYLFVGMTLLS